MGLNGARGNSEKVVESEVGQCKSFRAWKVPGEVLAAENSHKSPGKSGAVSRAARKSVEF